MKNEIIKQLIIVSIIIIGTFVIFSSFEEKTLTILDSFKMNKTYYSLISFSILSSDILLPIPSSIIMYLNGSILGVTLATITSSLSLVVSSTIGYCLGKLGYRLKKGNTELNKHLKNNGRLAIILSKGIPILSEGISIIAGFNNYDFKKFSIQSVIGIIPIAFVYSILGSLAINQYGFAISFTLLLLISLLLFKIGKARIANNI